MNNQSREDGREIQTIASGVCLGSAPQPADIIINHVCAVRKLVRSLQIG